MVRVWQIVTSRPVLALCALLAGVLLAGECRGHREDNRVLTVPVRAPDTPQATKMERAPLAPDDGPVTKLKPTKKQRAKVEKKFHLEPNLPILALKTIPPAPDGGELMTTLPVGGGELQQTFVPNPERFARFIHQFGLGGEVATGSDGKRWDGYAFYEPLRLRRTTIRLRAGWQDRPEDDSWFLGAGIETRFR